MLQGEHSAILLTFIKLPFVIKIFVLIFFGVAVLHRFYCTIMKKIPNESKLIYILLENQKCNHFMTLFYIAFFNLLFIPVSSVFKTAPLPL